MGNKDCKLQFLVEFLNMRNIIYSKHDGILRQLVMGKQDYEMWECSDFGFVTSYNENIESGFYIEYAYPESNLSNRLKTDKMFSKNFKYNALTVISNVKNKIPLLIEVLQDFHDKLIKAKI